MKSLLFLGYSGFMKALWLAAKAVSNAFNLASKQQFNRPNSTELINELRQLHFEKRPAIFLVSSAGEYEQAKPVISMLQDHLNIPSVIFFISISGHRFAASQQETTAFYLAPPDSFHFWKTVTRALRPSCALLVRYEIWPGFLGAMSESTPMFLINASPSKSFLSAVIQKWTLRYFRTIFAVQELPSNIHNHVVPNHRSVVVGDTKYDRVIERQRETNGSEDLENCFKSINLPSPRLIIGSSWGADLSLVLNGAASKIKSRAIGLIIAPHDLSKESLEGVVKSCQHFGIKTIRWTEIDDLGKQLYHEPYALILDQLGLLFEFYAVCNIALIGGGLHHKVHNVLEAACFNLAICYGPRYTTHPEAVRMIQENYTTVVSNSDEFSEFLEQKLEDGFAANTREFVLQKSGAAERIVSTISQEIGPSL
jgi:3-deoxy-D-manno-octulosonic-acid transferase